MEHSSACGALAARAHLNPGALSKLNTSHLEAFTTGLFGMLPFIVFSPSS
jgi:hypothetical protein